MDVESVEVVQRVPEADPYPITPKEHGIDFLMDHRHLWLRSRRQHAVLACAHEVIKAHPRLLRSQRLHAGGHADLHAGGLRRHDHAVRSRLFRGREGLSTQSGQLYNEANAMAFGKVYCFGPTFRAEKSKTRRHLTEFWMVEPEMAYADLEDVKRVGRGPDRLRRRPRAGEPPRRAEGAGARRHEAGSDQGPVPAHELRRCGEEAASQRQRDPVGRRLRRRRRDACSPRTRPSGDGGPLSRPRSRRSTSQPDPSAPEVALGVDVIAPEGYGEIIGGGQRIHDLDLLLKRLEEHKLPKEAFDWYLDLRKYGAVPHAGFGMGVERCVAWICGTRARPRDHPVPAHALPDAAVNAAIVGSRSSARPWISAPAAAASTWVLRRMPRWPARRHAWRVSAMRSRTRQCRCRPAGERTQMARSARAICRRSRKPVRALRTMVERRSSRRQVPGGAGRRSLHRDRHRLRDRRDTIAKQEQKIGLIWIDAHADMNTPETTPSGNVHGMPLACCIGMGPPELTSIFGYAPKVEPRNVAIVGLRDVDVEESAITSAAPAFTPSPCATSMSAACAP